MPVYLWILTVVLRGFFSIATQAGPSIGRMLTRADKVGPTNLGGALDVIRERR